MTALIPPERGVNGSQDDDGNRGPEVYPESLSLIWSSAADHFIGQRQCDGRHIQPCAGSEQSRDHEHCGSRIFCRNSEARGQVFVDRIDFVIVIRLDEDVADENAPDDGAKGEL